MILNLIKCFAPLISRYAVTNFNACSVYLVYISLQSTSHVYAYYQLKLNIKKREKKFLNVKINNVLHEQKRKIKYTQSTYICKRENKGFIHTFVSLR